MSLDAILPITIALADPPIGLLDFGTPLVATLLTSDQQTAFGSDATRIVTPANWQAQMSEVGVSTSEPAYLALRTLFAQRPVKPSQAVWGSREDPVAQVVTVTVPASPAAVNYIHTINGEAHSVAGSGLTQTELRDALIAAIQGGAQAGNVTAASASGSTYTVTSDLAGVPFSSTLNTQTGFSQVTTTPSVGLIEDIAAMRAENSFYLVMEDSRDIEALFQLAQVIETYSGEGGVPPLFLLGQTLDPLAQSTSALTDLQSRLTALNLERTAIVWNDDDAEWIDAALAGKVLPTKPGSNTWANQPLSGVSGLVPDNDTRLRSKRYTWLESYVAAGFSMSQGARTASGHPIDLILGRDWLRNLIQIRLAELLRDNPKVPYTDKGGRMIGDTVRGALIEAAGAPYEFLDEDSIVVSVLRRSQQTSTDAGNRLWAGTQWSALAQGAVEQIPISGTITP